jgi:hypothetical protein
MNPPLSPGNASASRRKPKPAIVPVLPNPLPHKGKIGAHADEEYGDFFLAFSH